MDQPQGVPRRFPTITTATAAFFHDKVPLTSCTLEVELFLKAAKPMSSPPPPPGNIQAVACRSWSKRKFVMMMTITCLWCYVNSLWEGGDGMRKGEREKESESEMIQ